MAASILVVEDELTMQELVEESLSSRGYKVATARSGEEALARMAEQDFDVIVSDIVMPGVGGLEVLERSRTLNPRAAVILMTAYANVQTAAQALRQGASEYLEKPFRLEVLAQRVHDLLQHRELVLEQRVLHQALHHDVATNALVGESDAIREVREQIRRSARTPSNVLITGESGAGKELVASAVHSASARRDHPFVAVNCGAIPETLLESQLFGHVRGAFTNAVQTNPGLFVTADEGTLFLDEIGELSFPLQVKLLRVIEERQVWPVGGTKPVPVDVRIIASTNRDLAREITDGRFREDLFYRLNVVHIKLPPLRERRSDIPLLIDHFIKRLNVKLGTAFLGVDREAARVLRARPWKGNVRELENILERAMVLGEGNIISLEHLNGEVSALTPRPRNLRKAVRHFVGEHIRDVLAESQFDKREAARILGISLASLYRKLDIKPDAAATPADGARPEDPGTGM